MMKDDEYSDIISKQKKKIQQLTAAATQRRKHPKNTEADFIQQLKAKIKNGNRHIQTF
jgi:hypothetical protein